MWRYFKGQHFSFWMICLYLFFEYSRPQSIFPVIDFLPWAQLFLVGALIGAFLDKSVKWVSNPINFFMIWFAIAIFISSLTAYYPEISQDHYIDFYGWFVIYFLIITIVNTKQRLYIFLIIFLISAAKIAIGTSKNWAFRGFSFSKWGLTGPPGYFQNSGELSILMLTLFPLAFLCFLLMKNKIGKAEQFLLLLFWVTPVLTILGASSRGSQLALAVQLFIIFRKNIFKFKRLIGIFVLIFVIYNILPEEQKLRFEATGEDKSSQQRLLYWEHGWGMLKEHPWFGVGFFNFPAYYDSHFPEDVLYGAAQLPHNIFIQVGTDAGFFALVPFSILLFAPFWISRKAIHQLRRDSFLKAAIVGGLYGLIGFIVAGQFVTVTYYPFLWIGLSFIVSALNISKNDSKSDIDVKSGVVN